MENTEEAWVKQLEYEFARCMWPGEREHLTAFTSRTRTEAANEALERAAENVRFEVFDLTKMLPSTSDEELKEATYFNDGLIRAAAIIRSLKRE